MSDAVQYLDMKKACFICTNNAFDEVTLTHPTSVIETMDRNGLYSYQLTNEAFNFPTLELKDIQGSSAKENASIIYKIFSGKEKTPGYFVVVANAALALKVAGVSDDLNVCIQAAEDSILSGRTLKKLNELKDFGDKYK